MLVTTKEARRFIGARVAPEYRRTKVAVFAARSVTLHDLNWSGGTRAEYWALRLADMAPVSLEGMSDSPPWANRFEGMAIDLVPGFAIVKTGHFCGKPSMMAVTFHPGDFPPALAELERKLLPQH